jgi:predicted transporter
MNDVFFVVPVCAAVLMRDAQLLALCPNCWHRWAIAAYGILTAGGVCAIYALHPTMGYSSSLTAAILRDPRIWIPALLLHAGSFALSRHWCQWNRAHRSWGTVLVPLPVLMAALAVIVGHCASPNGWSAFPVAMLIVLLWTILVCLLRSWLLRSGAIIEDVSFSFFFVNLTNILGLYFVPVYALGAAWSSYSQSIKTILLAD